MISKKNYVVENEECYETSHAKVEINKNTQTVECRLKHYISDRNFIRALLKIVDFAEKNQVKRVLFDASEYEGSPVEIHEWVNENWSEKAANMGIKRLAIVLPKNIYGSFSIKNSLGEKLNNLIHTCKFRNKETAKKWLL